MVKNFLLIVLLGCFSTQMFAEGNADNGKSLFKTNCASCHDKKMLKKSTGPALKGVLERWEGREDLLRAWIRNSSQVLASGDKYANDLFASYNGVEMTAFPSLTEQNIDDLLAHIKFVSNGGGGANVAVKSGGLDAAPRKSYTWFYWAIFGVLVLLSLIIGRLTNSLRYFKSQKEGDVTAQIEPVLNVFTSKFAYGLGVFLLVLFGGYSTFNGAVQLGRQQGYEPTQPIKFSHKTHAGINKIDCKYCHDGARRSKHSVIPATSTCMNCHIAITTGSKYGTGEITKIFASIGYNPNKGKYIENYDDLSQEKIEKIYKEWIESNVEGGGAEAVADRQWSEIKSSLTNDKKPNIQGPINWIRIHALPDHVYYNHSQHVTVGGLECQTCHGKVEDMEVVKQHAPLSMGWCINCHRKTNVNFKENNYYKSYAKFQKEIKAGERKNVTVEEIGGTECQKCHY